MSTRLPVISRVVSKPEKELPVKRMLKEILLYVFLFYGSLFSQVRVWEEPLVLPTYEVKPPDVNPMFWRPMVYQGASRVVYPYPLMDNVTNIRGERTYKALYLENEYIKLSFLRAQSKVRIIRKTTLRTGQSPAKEPSFSLFNLSMQVERGIHSGRCSKMEHKNDSCGGNHIVAGVYSIVQSEYIWINSYELKGLKSDTGNARYSVQLELEARRRGLFEAVGDR